MGWTFLKCVGACVARLVSGITKRGWMVGLLGIVLVVVGGLPGSCAFNDFDYGSEKTTTTQYEANYFKCRCEGNQAWNGSSCVSVRTKVNVTDPESNVPKVTLTDNFEGVTVKEVQCPPSHLRIKLDPNLSPTHDFTLLPNGLLSWHEQEYEYYCIEHILDPVSFDLTWQASVCLPPPPVPICCLNNASHTQDGSSSSSCSNDTSGHEFSPSIMIDQTFFSWPQVMAIPRRISCNQNEKLTSFPLNSGTGHLYHDSGAVSLAWKTPYYFTETRREGFCVRLQEGGVYESVLCQEDQEAIHREVCANVTCVRKCCPVGEVYSELGCVMAEEESHLWRPSLVDADLSTIVSNSHNLTILHGRPHCFMYEANPDEYEEDKFYLLKNGDLFTPFTNDRDPPNRYCVDNFVTADKISTRALICLVESPAESVCTTAKSTVYPALLLVSSTFLGVTLAVYLSVPELRDKLHGRCLISLASAFFTAYVLMSVSYLCLMTSTTLDKSICISLAFFKHMSLLAAFFWLNVMCFDIWRTLRKTRTVNGQRWNLHRFLWYSLYAWGASLLIALVALGVELSAPSPNIVRPNFDYTFCWFSDTKSVWVYLYMWVSLVLVSNIVFFTLVLVILIKGQNNSLLRRSRQMNRERMWLYVKLFLVMGITWVAEVVSYQHGRCAEWMFTDIINTLQGFTLFLVFILNRSTLRKLRERWKCCAALSKHTKTTTTTTTTTSCSSTRRENSVLSERFNSSLISREYSAIPSSSAPTELKTVSPMDVVNEAAEDSSRLPHHESPSAKRVEEETARIENGSGENSALLTGKNTISVET